MSRPKRKVAVYRHLIVCMGAMTAWRAATLPKSGFNLKVAKWTRLCASLPLPNGQNVPTWKVGKMILKVGKRKLSSGGCPHLHWTDVISQSRKHKDTTVGCEVATSLNRCMIGLHDWSQVVTVHVEGKKWRRKHWQYEEKTKNIFVNSASKIPQNRLGAIANNCFCFFKHLLIPVNDLSS